MSNITKSKQKQLLKLLLRCFITYNVASTLNVTVDIKDASKQLEWIF